MEVGPSFEPMAPDMPLLPSFASIPDSSQLHAPTILKKPHIHPYVELSDDEKLPLRDWSWEEFESTRWSKGPQRAVPRIFISSGLLWHSDSSTLPGGRHLLHCTGTHVEYEDPEFEQTSERVAQDLDSETEEDRASKPSFKRRINDEEERWTAER